MHVTHITMFVLGQSSNYVVGTKFASDTIIWALNIITNVVAELTETRFSQLTIIYSNYFSACEHSCRKYRTFFSQCTCAPHVRFPRASRTHARHIPRPVRRRMRACPRFVLSFMASPLARTAGLRKIPQSELIIAVFFRPCPRQICPTPCRSRKLSPLCCDTVNWLRVVKNRVNRDTYRHIARI